MTRTEGTAGDTDQDNGGSSGGGVGSDSKGDGGSGDSGGESAGGSGDSPGSSDRRRGDRFVLALYAVLVALTGVFGFVIGLIRPEDLDPRLFVVIDLPPTPAGMALYGMVTVGVVLGLLLTGVRYVAREYDSADAGAAGPTPRSPGTDGDRGERAGSGEQPGDGRA